MKGVTLNLDVLCHEEERHAASEMHGAECLLPMLEWRRSWCADEGPF